MILLELDLRAIMHCRYSNCNTLRSSLRTSMYIFQNNGNSPTRPPHSMMVIREGYAVALSGQHCMYFMEVRPLVKSVSYEAAPPIPHAAPPARQQGGGAK